MLRCLLVLLLAAACGADGEPAAPPPTGEAGIEVVHYDYRFDLETGDASVVATVLVREGGDCLTLPFRAQRLREGTLDGQPPVAAELTEGGARLCAAVGWPPDTTVLVGAAMTVPQETWEDSQVGYSVSLDIEDAPFHYLVSWVGGCDRFGPCDAAPDRFARYRFTVTHPEGTRVLCPGSVTAGSNDTVCDFDHPGGPTYSTFGFAASPSWTEVELGAWSGVEVTLYDMPSAGFALDFDVERHAAFFQWMIDRFGPYPYGDELRFAIGPTYWNGFEHPGNIVLNDRLNALGPFDSLYADPLAHTIDHEIAHQWAGDQTTLAGVHDFVWKEAMVEYLVFAFEAEHISPGSALQTNLAWKRFARGAEYWPVPLEGPALLDYYGDVYGPGPMVLFRQVEALFDRETVLAALEALLGSERAIAVADVQSALEDATGADLSAYFDAWVYGEGVPSWPTFAVEVTPGDGGEHTVTVRQDAAEDGLYGAAFVVQLRGGTEEDPLTHDVRFDLGPDGAAEATELTTPGFEVTSVGFDPYGDTLGLHREAAQAAPAPGRNPWVAPLPPRRLP